MKKAVCGMLVMVAVIAAGSAHAVTKEWKEKHSSHFVIYYKDTPEDFLKRVTESAETYYVDITRGLGFTRFKSWSYDEKARIYIYSDREDYLSDSQHAGWSHGTAFARNKIIRTFPAAHGFFDSLLPHELGHIIFREFIGYTVVLPSWIEEGVAMYQEAAQRWGADQFVREAFETERFIPLMELSRFRPTHDMDQSLVDLYYYEAASAVGFMIREVGEHRFMNFCRLLKDGKNFEEALKTAYPQFQGVEGLNRAWMAYLKK